MRCPHCNGTIPDGAAICPQCDAILDATFLDASTEPGAAGQGGPPPPGLTAPPLLGGAPDLSGHTEGTSILQLDPERQKETRIVKMSDLASGKKGPASPSRAAAARVASAVEEEALGDLWGQLALAYRRLRPLEKAVFFSLLGLFVCAFLPWFHVRGEGFVSGIEGKGALTAVLTFLAVVIFWVRVSFRWVLLVLGQVFLVAGAGLAAGWAYKATAGAIPSFGIYLTLLTSAAAAVLSLVAVVK